MTAYLKSEIPNDADFNRSNQAKIESAIEAVRKRHHELLGQRLDGYKWVELCDEFEQTVTDVKTLLDAWKWLHANYHHFQKYHAADADAWDHGQHYIGTECVNCEFSRSQQRAIDDNAKLARS